MTLDTKALEAAIKAGENNFYSQRGGTVADAVRAAIKAYLATRSQSLPDELKAIAERHEKTLGIIADDMASFETAFFVAHNDRADLLSVIDDVVRACAGKISDHEAIWKHLPDAPCAESSLDDLADLKSEILSILDHPIKSEQQIREEERERCANLVRALRGPIDTANLKGGAAYQLGLQDAEINIRNGKTEG